mgnify:CR=1 FL=1
MINKTSKYITLVGLSIGLLTSCYKLDVENPNGGQNPSFETAKNAAGYIYTGQFARMSAMLTQQLKGEDIHYEPIYENYILPDNKLTNSYNTAYRHGISLAIDRKDDFENQLGNSDNLSEETIVGLQKSKDEGAIVAGLIYSVVNEFFSNTERYNGRETEPTALKYSDIIELFDGIEHEELKNAAELAKARVFLNQGMYSNVVTILTANGIDLNGFYSIEYSGSSTNMNEWPRFIGARGGYLNADSNNIVNSLMINDPRLVIYYTSDETFDFPMSRNGEVNLIGSIEAHFMLAEAQLREGNTSAAQTAFETGIMASMNLTGVSDYSEYMSNNGTLSTDFDMALNQIMTEKYIGLFGHPQVFIDYKRTKLPQIVEKNGNFPDKWMYFYQ